MVRVTHLYYFYPIKEGISAKYHPNMGWRKAVWLPNFIAHNIAMENSTQSMSSQKMLVATSGRVDIVSLQQLVRIEAQSNYSKLVFADGHFLVVAKVLKKFEEQLNQNLFIRAHKTHLVNSLFIRSYEGQQHKTLVLENGENITVARSKHTCVLNQLLAMKAV